MTKQEKSAGAIVYYLNQQNEPVFLFLQNTLKKTYWEVPKGKIQANENIEQTILREVKEETNLSKLKIIPGFKHNLKWFFKLHDQLIHKQATYLLIKIPESEKSNVKISNEHEKFAFMDYQEAMKNLNIKANKLMIQEAYKFIKKYEQQHGLF